MVRRCKHPRLKRSVIPATVHETSMTVLSSRMAIHGETAAHDPSTDTRSFRSVAASRSNRSISDPMAPFPLKFDDELRGYALSG
jgi:hypothetical protein